MTELQHTNLSKQAIGSLMMALQKSLLEQSDIVPVLEGFKFPNISIERCANGKGDYKNRGEKKILPIRYTPDFIGDDFIIECKGRANESFPLRWKMFKKIVKRDHPCVIIYKPQNQKECDITVELIQKQRSS